MHALVGEWKTKGENSSQMIGKIKTRSDAEPDLEAIS
jgi:hypothetical protein